jgi:hypothetical protein
MEKPITVTLPDDLELALEEETRREGISANDLIADALKRYLFVRRFRLLREQMIPHAQAQGIHTDEDVFEQVS